MARWVELAGDDPGREAAVGGQHLVGADHRKPLAEREHDARRDAGQLGREFDRPGRRYAASALRVVEPVDAEEVQRMGRVGIDGVEAPDDGLGDGRGVLQLAERRQHDAGLAETRQRSPVDVAIDQTRFQPEPRHACVLRRPCRRVPARRPEGGAPGRLCAPARATAILNSSEFVAPPCRAGWKILFERRMMRRVDGVQRSGRDESPQRAPAA